MSHSPSQFDVSSLNGVQQRDCWRHHSLSFVCVRSVACLGFCRFHQCKKPGSRSIWSCTYCSLTVLQFVFVHQLTWYNSLWLWRWLPHRLSKRQSLSTTIVLFRTTFTVAIKLNLLLGDWGRAWWPKVAKKISLIASFGKGQTPLYNHPLIT